MNPFEVQKEEESSLESLQNPIRTKKKKLDHFDVIIVTLVSS